MTKYTLSTLVRALLLSMLALGLVGCPEDTTNSDDDTVGDDDSFGGMQAAPDTGWRIELQRPATEEDDVRKPATDSSTTPTKTTTTATP